jgi:hypothetical protein
VGHWFGIALTHVQPASPSQEQNGDTHHAGDWRGPGRDSLPLPVRSRKYQEGSDTTDRRPRDGSHSPLDSADVRVQVPRTVGASPPPRPALQAGGQARPGHSRDASGPDGLSARAMPWALGVQDSVFVIFSWGLQVGPFCTTDLTSLWASLSIFVTSWGWYFQSSGGLVLCPLPPSPHHWNPPLGSCV